MGILSMALRSLKGNLLSTLITAFSIALSCGLMMAVYAVKEQSKKAFVMNDVGFDAVVGAKGSPMQLVLNSLYHLEESPGNIPWSLYVELKSNRRAVKRVVPLAVGDNYYGYRLVGTIKDLFQGDGFKLSLDEGRVFDEDREEAIIGSVVAERTGLKVGDDFSPFHGLNFIPGTEHSNKFKIVGVLKNTNTPNDRVIWIPIDSHFRMQGHVLRGTGKDFDASGVKEIPDEHKEVSSLLVQTRSPMNGRRLSGTINRGSSATMAWPVAGVMLKLFDKLGWVHKVLELVSWLIIVVAATTVLVSVYNTLNDRKREFAILRSLGAPKSELFKIILMQSLLLSLLGVMGSFVFYFMILSAAGRIIRDKIGIMLDSFAYSPILWIGPLVMIGIALLTSLIPAVKAYRIDVVKNLSPES
jgi:putative ABC transport system permease protein